MMADLSEHAEWVAVDWGTSNLRVWVMDARDRIIASAGSDRGMGTLARDEFEPALLDLIAPHLADDRAIPVLCCGMAGSRQGWAEAAYLNAPCQPPDGHVATRVSTHDPRIAVSILPGVKQTVPADVMRGEETQIAGFMRGNLGFAGVLCLPGTHTKWVRMHADRIDAFKTFMTGELFALLSGQSVLRHSVATDHFDQPAFDAAVSQALAAPQELAAQLFGLRAGTLIANLQAAAARARLSGLLIGAELAAARPFWGDRTVALIGDSGLSALYRSGLAAQGVETTVVDVVDMTLNGLRAAYHSQKEATS